VIKLIWYSSCQSTIASVSLWLVRMEGRSCRKGDLVESWRSISSHQGVGLNFCQRWRKKGSCGFPPAQRERASSSSGLMPRLPGPNAARFWRRAFGHASLSPRLLCVIVLPLTPFFGVTKHKKTAVTAGRSVGGASGGRSRRCPMYK
jgi:hypothetical protein